MRNQLDRYAAPARVDWHLACITNRWTKRALASAGFGYPSPDPSTTAPYQRWKPIFSVAEIGGDESAAAAAENREMELSLKRRRTEDLEASRTKSVGGERDAETISKDWASTKSGFDGDLDGAKAYKLQTSRVAVVHGLNRPLFHMDLTSALQSAVANVERRREEEELVARVSGAETG